MYSTEFVLTCSRSWGAEDCWAFELMLIFDYGWAHQRSRSKSPEYFLYPVIKRNTGLSFIHNSLQNFNVSSRWLDMYAFVCVCMKNGLFGVEREQGSTILEYLALLWCSIYEISGVVGIKTHLNRHRHTEIHISTHSASVDRQTNNIRKLLRSVWSSNLQE